MVPYAGDLQARVRGVRKWGKARLEIVRKHIAMIWLMVRRLAR